MARGRPKKIGRPSKYKPEFDEQLINHMASGYSFESFGSIVKVCKDTLYEWEKTYPSFSYSKKRGTLASLYKWEQIGLDAAKGVYAKFNAASWIFTMKCRFREFGYVDKIEIENKGVLEQIDNLTEKQVQEEIERLTRIISGSC